jgi:hypothetical protein
MASTAMLQYYTKTMNLVDRININTIIGLHKKSGYFTILKVK